MKPKRVWNLPLSGWLASVLCAPLCVGCFLSGDFNVLEQRPRVSSDAGVLVAASASPTSSPDGTHAMASGEPIASTLPAESDGGVPNAQPSAGSTAYPSVGASAAEPQASVTQTTAEPAVSVALSSPALVNSGAESSAPSTTSADVADGGPDSTASAAPSSSTSAPAGSASAPQADVAWIYTGGNTPCANQIDTPYTGAWEGWDDGTGDVGENAPAGGGVGGSDDCAMHFSASNLRDWGGGGGFPLEQVNGDWELFDASQHLGLRLWLKGTLAGSHNAQQMTQDNIIFVEVMSGPDYGQEAYGFFCEMNPDAFTVCEALFDDLVTDGGPLNYAFDATEIRGIALEMSPMWSGAPVSYDFWVDDISFL